MREFKFRSWDKALKQMSYSPLNAITFDGRIYYGNADFTDYPQEIMQYTGLKDKNGKEIYEGDILGQHGFWDILVEFENGCFKAKSADKVRYNNECVNIPLYDSYGLKNFEIIGNIHEKPELLEGE